MQNQEKDIMQKLQENWTEEHTDKHTAPAAVYTEVTTTKTPGQKAEIAEELFPHKKPPRSMRTRRVMH